MSGDALPAFPWDEASAHLGGFDPVMRCSDSEYRASVKQSLRPFLVGARVSGPPALPVSGSRIPALLTANPLGSAVVHASFHVTATHSRLRDRRLPPAAD